MLTADQWRFIAARLLAKTDKEAAEQVGINPQTASNWKQESAEFKTAYEDAFADAVSVAKGYTRALLGKASERLSEALDATKTVEVQLKSTVEWDKRKHFEEITVPDWKARLDAAKLILQAQGVLQDRLDVTSGGKTLRILIGDGSE
jgi:hypothetical protein